MFGSAMCRWLVGRVVVAGGLQVVGGALVGGEVAARWRRSSHYLTVMMSEVASEPPA